MELHERFMKLPTTGINVLATLAGNRDKELQIIRELIEAYNKRISNEVLDLKSLEAFRMLLCSEYQALINSKNEDEPLKCLGRLYTDLRRLFIKNNELQKTEEFSVLYDIAVLQLVFSAKPLLRMAFKDFWDYQDISSSADNLDLSMRVAECFADSYNLHNYIYEPIDNCDDLGTESDRILGIILSWMKRKEGLEWKLLASLLPKLTVTFEPQKIISPLWEHAIGSIEISPPFTSKEFSEIPQLEDKLTVLCVIADVCFPSKIERVKEFHYELCLQNEFWCILHRGLVSKNLQERKQGLYLMKRALDFVDIHKSELRKRLKPLEKSAMPFLCTKEEDSSSLDEAKKSFFLILEVLEEKQNHLVLPTLSHLRNIVNLEANHESCCDCFNPIWLRCVYQKIVQHDNDSVKILGLQEILKSEPHIFSDYDFLVFFVHALNNTFLYDYKEEEEKPVIVKELEETFLKWEQKKLTLINTFVRMISSISWGPVALFWILQALSTVTQRCTIETNLWGHEELCSIAELLGKSIPTNDRSMRYFCQIPIIRIFRACVNKPIESSTLEYIFGIMYELSDNKQLVNGLEDWSEIGNQLRRIIDPMEATEYITERCEKMYIDDLNLKYFAASFCLVIESQLICTDPACPALKAAYNLLQNLIGADVRPYVNKDEIRKVLQFVGYLITFNMNRQHTISFKKINALITPFASQIMRIVLKSLDGKTVSKYDEYLYVVTAILSDPENIYKFLAELNHIEDKCMIIITNLGKYCRPQWYYAIKMLLICRNHVPYTDEWTYGITLIPPLLDFVDKQIGDEEEDEKNKIPKDQIPPDCPDIIARLLSRIFNSEPSSLRLMELPWIKSLLTLIETGNERVIDPVSSILGLILAVNMPLEEQYQEIIKSIVRTSWRIFFGLKKSSVDVDLVNWLIAFTTSSTFLDIEGSNDFAFECIEQMMKEGDTVPFLKLILLQCNYDMDMICSHNSFMSCLLHGAVPRRDQRIERAAISHGQNLSDNKELSILNSNMGVAVRMRAIECLFGLKYKTNVQENVLNHLLEILEQNKNKRYFDNSHLHRLKQRVMQTLLIQEPFLSDMQRKRLHDALCSLLIAESNQPSVRLMHEWLLIRLHVKSHSLRDSIWKLFDTAADKRPGSIVSIASVIFHVARVLVKRTRREYIVKGILRLLPNCMGQQFNVRLYSQTVLVKIYKMLPTDSEETVTYKETFESVEQSLRRGNSLKNSTKLLDDFFFTIFDPEEDYNLETIYNVLPRLTNVAPDELIPREILEPCCLGIGSLSREVLHSAKPSVQSSKPTGDSEAPFDSSTNAGPSDIQKKIMPWKTIVPFYDDLSEASKARLLQRRTQSDDGGGIIVVASLIDRPPNLGGIARTCEIFGAKELVIGSLRYVEDREFQTLSVSAEKWITITEVKSHLLKKYLLEKQTEGWKLIAAEQTANSMNLLEMEFPKKTILLLGNEKDGIPANLIPLMDTCVEIPQNGVVRSLNVHVTGAICIWQYAKQHVLT